MTADQIASGKVFDLYWCKEAFTSTDVTVDTANSYKIKIDHNKIHEVKKICYKCNTKFVEGAILSNVFNIKSEPHPCNTAGTIFDPSKVLNVLGSDEKELNYKKFTAWDLTTTL